MKILIIGGGGFVGSWFTRELISRKHQVVVIDPFVYYSPWNEKTKRTISKFKKENLLKGAKVYKRKFEDGGEKILKKEKPDSVVLLAGIPLEKAADFDLSLKQLTEDIGLTYKVLKAIKESQVKKLVFMSSIAAYGDCDDVIDESGPLIPKTPYGVTKACSEFLVQAELTNWNIIRTTNVYGFGDMNGRASNIILNKILNKEKFLVNNMIDMDFIYVKDLVAGIADVLLKAPLGQIYHISGGNARKLIDFTKILGNYYTFEYEVSSVKDRPRRGTMDNTKARKAIGWYPRRDIEKGIADYIKYVKKYKIA